MTSRSGVTRRRRSWGLAGDELLGGHGLVLVPAAGVFMAAVGLLAAADPRQALRIDPAAALRDL